GRRSGESLLGAGAALAPINRGNLGHGSATLFRVTDEKSLDAIANDLWSGAARTRNHRRAAGQGFREYDPERLVPLDRHDHCRGRTQERDLGRVIERTHIVYAVAAEFRLDPGGPIFAFVSAIGVIAGDQQS